MRFGGNGLGDIAPFPAPHPYPRPELLDTNVANPQPPVPVLDTNRTFISMQQADVEITFKQQSTNQIAVTVKGRFLMSCLRSKESSTTFMMSLPVGYDSVGEMQLIELTVDGKTRQDYQKEQWFDPRFKRELQGFTWPTTVSAGTTQTVSVVYEEQLPVVDNQSSFTYMLRSGGKWHGPIGQEIVQVKADPGLDLIPAESASLKPAREADGSIVWQIWNTVPKEDIVIKIKTPPPPS